MALAAYKYNTAQNGLSADTVYDAATNKPFSSGDEFLKAGGSWGNIQVRPGPVSASSLKNPALQFPPTPPARDPGALVGAVGTSYDAGTNTATLSDGMRYTPTPTAAAALTSGQPQQQAPQPPSTDLNQAADNYEQLYKRTMDPNQQQLIDNGQRYLNDAESAGKTLEGKGTALTNAENALGVPQDFQQLQEVSKQLAAKNAAFQVQDQTIETNGILHGVPGVFYQGEQAALRRQQAVEIGALASYHQALQGNFQLAKDYAQHTVDIQFQGAQQKLDNAKQFLAMNQTLLSAAEKRQAEKIAGTLQEQQRLLDKQKQSREFAITNGIKSPYYQVGGTIYRTSDGYGFHSMQEFTRAGGSLGQVQEVNHLPYTKENLIGDKEVGYYSIDPATGRPTLVLPGAGNAQVVKIGEHTNPDTGETVPDYAVFDSVSKTLTSINDLPQATGPGAKYSTPSGITGALGALFPDGSVGGQCGTFAHNLSEFSPVGDSLQAKKAAVAGRGIDAPIWRQEGAVIGDVLIEDYGKSGHVAVVTGVNPDDTVTVKESNFHGDGKVGTRTVSVNDPHILGAIRAPLKGSNQPAPVSPTVQAYAQQYASQGTYPTGMPKGLVGPVSNAAKDLPKQTGEIVNAQTNVRPPKDDSKVNALSDLYSTIELAKQLKELDTQRTKGIWGGIVNNLDSNNKRYNDLRTQITDLLARARTGAAINASEEALYSKMLPGRLSNPLGIGTNTQASIENFVNNLSNDLTQKASANGWSIYGVSKVTVNGKQYTVGDILDNGKTKARVNPDGTLTPL